MRSDTYRPSASLCEDPEVMAMALEGYHVTYSKKYSDYLVVTHNGLGWYFMDLDQVKRCWARDWDGIAWWDMHFHEKSQRSR